ncbi:dihydropteroate synthase [Aquilutibacter rugosus]|uniref:dihydropteroate synthase n=1 Tax=Aquilutibacter rugosus TaxID=3115820 RepID=UPI002F424010
MFDTVPVVRCGAKSLRLERPQLMGIVNVTPDSFSDGGDFVQTDVAVAHALQLIEDGADILDIGGESTRPGAATVSAEQELARVVPVIRQVAAYIAERQLPTLISVDTYKPAVMQAAVEAGADLINDVRALTEPGALDVVAKLDCGVVLMHFVGTPADMQTDPHYDDVTAEVHRFLTERIFACELAGIRKDRLIADPGFGFGKTTAHNMELLARLDWLRDLGVPVLAGLSRKRSLGELTGRSEPKQRVAASVAAHLIAVQHGAMIVRVHDVAATRDALIIRQATEPFKRPRTVAPKSPAAALWPED